MEKLSSMKPVPGAKKFGNLWSRAFVIAALAGWDTMKAASRAQP